MREAERVHALVLAPREAVRRALAELQDDEGVVVFYEDYDAVQAILRGHGAEPAAGLRPVALAGVG